MLKLRPTFRPFFKVIVGDGRSTSLWFDDWMPQGPIHTTMGDRVIYDSGLPRTAKVQDILSHGTWRWPIANSPDLLMLKEFTLTIPAPNISQSDTVIWRNSNEHTYSTKNAWNQIREVKSKVA